jgi:hypothetical protein
MSVALTNMSKNIHAMSWPGTLSIFCLACNATQRASALICYSPRESNCDVDKEEEEGEERSRGGRIDTINEPIYYIV